MIKRKIAIILTIIMAAFAVPCTSVYAAGTGTLGGAEIPDRFTDNFDVENCLDISSWNGEITEKEWQILKDNGVTGVIIRAGYSRWFTGFHSKDSRFEENMEGARKAGMDIGAYYYTTATNEKEAAKEAEYFAKLLEPYRDYLTLPVVYDFESNEHGRLDAAKFRELGPKGCTDMCVAFCEVLENEGYDPMIYANRATFNRYLDTSVLEGSYRLWLAQFTNDGSATGYEGNYDMWQYSSSVRIPGVDSRFDANYIFKRNISEDKEIADAKGEIKGSISTFTLSEGVRSIVPVTSTGDKANIRVRDNYGYSHMYKVFKKSSKYSSEECLMACVLNGFFVSEKSINPKYFVNRVAPATIGNDYASKRDEGYVLSMSGITKILRDLRLDVQYIREIDDDVYVKIKSHLATGHPVIMSLKNPTSRWTDGNEVVLLLGMDENGYGIMADTKDRYWNKNDQRIKLVSVDELIRAMESQDDDDSSLVKSDAQQGGYILIDGD
ncbi:MAG: glycoside hydrolase family 25 protein [Bacillota bacterium]|nr:glycoside hydrolase family 25 protein [Bacillota bacterium]